MAEISYRQIVADGLWNNNVAFVQLLGLCPLLAVSSTAINGLGLGMATTLVLIASNATISIIRNWVRPEIRIPVFVMIIAAFVTAIELSMSAWFYELYRVLGIFIPLIVTNCAILGRAEAFASRQKIVPSIVDGAMMGIGFTIPLFILGALREISGAGTLFAQAHLMFGEGAHWLTMTLFPDYGGFLLAILPPGAFIGLGLLIALKNIIDARITAKNSSPK
ncbi:MAG: electron transport complex subunit E [Gammaproteobacteria bacterium]|nr:electron transport complex subunit E [Gammaproteobacteria bacterium]